MSVLIMSFTNEKWTQNHPLQYDSCSLMRRLSQNVVAACCCQGDGRPVSQQLWIRFQLLKQKRSEPSRRGGGGGLSPVPTRENDLGGWQSGVQVSIDYKVMHKQSLLKISRVAKLPESTRETCESRPPPCAKALNGSSQPFIQAAGRGQNHSWAGERGVSHTWFFLTQRRQEKKQTALKSARRRFDPHCRSARFTCHSCDELVWLDQRFNKKTTEIDQSEWRAWQGDRRAGKLLLQGVEAQAMHRPKPEVKKKSQRIVKR